VKRFLDQSGQILSAARESAEANHESWA